ncbi:hypothetical protein [Methylobacterium sp. WSM2598]|uniref:hypothetical protein n=1 Tax=Methylobacterium sp. WSM2598 TaxID=398261 RepID=UPI00035C67C0|nr:hypothetical protein [Methylobacterium sp. WSM2598]
MTTLPQGSPVLGSLACLAAVLSIVAGGMYYLNASYHDHYEMSRLQAVARADPAAPLWRGRHRAKPGPAPESGDERPETAYEE